MRTKTPLIVALATLAAACTPSSPVIGFAEGQKLYTENCAMCHGPSATGDSEIGQHMSPRPADLTRIAQRNGGTFPRARVLSKIDGYQRAEYEGIAMPAFGELFAGDAVPLDTGDGIPTPTPVDLVNLLTYLEAIQTSE